MPSEKEKTGDRGLSALLTGLCESGIDFILVGGLAAVIQGTPITTIDVDIVHHQTQENITALLTFLKSVDACHRRLDNKVIEPTAEHITGKGHCLLKTRLGPLDILGAIEGGHSYEDLIDHTIKIDFRGHSIHVLDLETLVNLKKLSKDPGDNQRRAVLEETLRQAKKEEMP